MINKDKLKNFEKLPADIRREFSLLANQYGEKKKTSGIFSSSLFNKLDQLKKGKIPHCQSLQHYRGPAK